MILSINSCDSSWKYLLKTNYLMICNWKYFFIFNHLIIIISFQRKVCVNRICLFFLKGIVYFSNRWACCKLCVYFTWGQLSIRFYRCKYVVILNQQINRNSRNGEFNTPKLNIRWQWEKIIALFPRKIKFKFSILAENKTKKGKKIQLRSMQLTYRFKYEK